MIRFEETKDGFIFSKDGKHLAIGIYEQGSFHLLHDERLQHFANAMTAFVFLGDIYEPYDNTYKIPDRLKPVDYMKKQRENHFV